MEESDHDFACETGAILVGPRNRKNNTTKLQTTCVSGVDAGHVCLDVDEAMRP